MTTFLLIRHAAGDHVGKTIVGRSPGVHLNELGRRQADRLAEQLSAEPVQAIYSSPLERARETAEPIARRLGLEVRTADEITELDFGDWTGRSLDELAADPTWQRFNTFRSGTRIPGGELMQEVQTRIVSYIERLRTESPEGSIALVSHGDVIRGAVAYYLGMPLDLLLRLEISPASVTAIAIAGEGPQVLYVNRACEPG